jgi:hypothetical protein
VRIPTRLAAPAGFLLPAENPGKAPGRVDLSSGLQDTLIQLLKRRIEVIRRFNLDGLRYSLHISQTGEVVLDLLGGMTRKGSAYRSCSDLFWDEPNFSDVDLGANALKLLSRVKAMLLEYVFRERPWRFGFAASTSRKAPIYRWIAGRLARKLGRYNLVEYPEGVFNFYRLAGQAAA